MPNNLNRAAVEERVVRFKPLNQDPAGKVVVMGNHVLRAIVSEQQ